MVVLVGILVVLVKIENQRAAQSLEDTIQRNNAAAGTTSRSALGGTVPAVVNFLESTPIGLPVGDTRPRITHIKIVDLDGNGLNDILVCDDVASQVSWIEQSKPGQYTERIVGDEIKGPAHLAPCDIDKDGDLDLLVAKMENIFPTNEKIGGVVVLENDGNQSFANHVLIDGIARVADVEAGDLDGDGDIDLAVGQFGMEDGEIRWMENLGGDWQFESHRLQNLSGPIHTPIADIDRDGDLDIVALVSQEWEEIYIFQNDGQAHFETLRIYGSTNEDYGSSGISLVDLDQDSDLDILYTNGDAFDYMPPGPRPWHGVQWLENQGRLEFAFHRIGTFMGAYFANAVDVDRDEDLDIVVVSSFNEWESPVGYSMVWFENDGAMAFARHGITTNPTHLLTLDAADMDGDGWVDFVSGGMHFYPPYDRMSRVLLWKNRWPHRNPDPAASTAHE
jgi:hypothetical protein